MFMRTWDYRGFAIEPVLALLRQIFDQKNREFFEKMIFFDFLINRSIRPILMKKCWGKLGMTCFDPNP